MIRFMMAWVFLGTGFSALAATPYKRTLSVKSNTYTKDGVFIGGKAGQGSSLLGVRRVYSAKAKLERVIVDLGDHEGRPAGANPGYFQVSMDAAAHRVVIDLAQLRLSKITESQIQNLFRKSPYVADAQLTLDPEDKAATMVLKLKRPMRLEVFQLKNKKKPGRVVIDLTPASSGEGSFLPVSKTTSSTRKTLSGTPAKRKSARGEAFE